MIKNALLGATLALSSSMSMADVFMDEEWAEKACELWNSNTTLTVDLATNDWMGNNSRGYKLIRLYRTDCGHATQVQLKIEDKNNKAVCTFGGLPDEQKLDKEVDYLLHATDKHWTEMGDGTYGPFKALMFGYLTVQGPYDEAMYSLTPFSEFLKLAGSIAGDKGKDNCPIMQKAAASKTTPSQSTPSKPTTKDLSTDTPKATK